MSQIRLCFGYILKTFLFLKEQIICYASVSEPGFPHGYEQ